MVSTQQLLIGAAALAFLVPERVGAAGTATGTFGTGLAQGITALGTIRISPEFAPNISPRLVPEVGLKTDFPDWLDVSSYFPRIGTGAAGADPEEEEVVEVVVPPEPIEKEIERKFELIIESGSDPELREIH